MADEKLEKPVDYLPPDMLELGWAEVLTEGCDPEGRTDGDCAKDKSNTEYC